jgi:carboxyl-terminal processing protease
MIRIQIPLTKLVVLTAILISGCSSTSTTLPTEPASPSSTPNVVVVIATPEPTETEAPAVGPLATVQALAQSVTITAPTAAPSGDDYVGMLRYAWDIVNENYVRGNFNGVDWASMLEKYLPRAEAIEDHEDFWDMMEEFIAELGDNHSRFVRPDRFASEFELPSDQEGSPWTGINIWPAREDEQLFIWYVCERGPAASAGLHRGDAILAIDGVPVVKTESGFDSSVYRGAIFGDGESDTVTLTVQQGPDLDPEEVTIRLGGASGCDGWRVELYSESPRIGYVRVPDFAGDTDVNILTAIGLLEDEKALDGLIVDVRHNPGGNSDRSIAVFTEGIFGKVGALRDDATQGIYRIRGPVKWNETTPVVVLTDGSSHSAAEYFSTAMQQSGRATIVGMNTAGNTEGISGFTLGDGSLIRLAVSTLELPDGTTLEGVGVTPDVLVPLGQWGLRAEPDLQVQAAINLLLGQ